MAQIDPPAILYRFGRFLFEPGRRALTADGADVPVSSRALDILLLLIEQRGRVVTKDEIFRAVWPGTVVEENNLAVQISALRRALGDTPGDRTLIATVPGRGYRFVAPVQEQPCEAAGSTIEVSGLRGPAAPGHAAAPMLSAAPMLPVASPPGATPRRRVARVAVFGAAAIVACVAVWAARLWRERPPPRMSIAVLPFRNLTGDPAQNYLADAVTDDLTTDLSHLPGATVIARESADTYKGRAARAQAIGRALGVRYLLEGSLSAADAAALHVNAQLIDSATGAHLWASAFDADRAAIDGVRGQIVRRLASVLDFTLVEVEAARSLHDRPNNPDAADLYLQARSVLDRDDSLDGLTAAQRLLERAIERDPSYADALAQLSLVLTGKIGDYDDPDEWRDHAEAAQTAARALSLAPQNPLALTAHGLLAWADDRCAEALPSLRLALSLDPGVVGAHDGLALCERELARIPQMIADLQETVRIDPAAPRNAARLSMIGFGQLLLGKPDQASDWLLRASAGIADHAAAPPMLGWQEWNRLYLIAAAWLSGDHAAAQAAAVQYRALCPHRSVWRLGAYDSRALAALPGHAAYLAALRDAGLPAFADEHTDFGVTQVNAGSKGDFDPTPIAVPGAATIDTAALGALLRGPAPPPVLDVGHGAAVPPKATLVWPQGVWGDPARLLAAAAPSDRAAPVVVMSDGVTGFGGYDAALRLVAMGYRRVLWYRGGEEAWVAYGNAAQDRRPQ